MQGVQLRPQDLGQVACLRLRVGFWVRGTRKVATTSGALGFRVEGPSW